MKNIIRSFANIFRRGSGSFTKIIMLGIGLAMGMTLIAKLYFEKSYENFVPDRDRTCRVVPLVEMDGKEKQYNSTPGYIAPGFKEAISSIELATRLTLLFSEEVIISTENNNVGIGKNGVVCEGAISADSCFFMMFPRKTIVGNLQETMTAPNKVVITKSLANRMLNSKEYTYRDLLGMVIAPQAHDDLTLAIGAVVEDFPKNSDMRGIEMIIPMVSIGKFTYDGSDRWIGNDRYASFVRLYPHTDMAELKAMTDKICEERIDPELSQNIKIRYNVIPLSEYHISFNETLQAYRIMLLLTFVVLAVSILNYILITLSALVRKAKTIAVRKCYGASQGNIYALVFSDTFVEMLVSLLLSVLLLFLFQNTVERLLGTSLLALVTPQSITLILAILLLIFVICGLFPSIIYSRTSLQMAFQNYKETNRRWKHILLTFQFVASAFFITLLIVIIMQYNFILHKETGYAYEHLVIANIEGFSVKDRDILQEEMAKLPFVTQQTFASDVLFSKASGNNLYLWNPDNNDFQELFNIADNYYVDDHYFELMEIPIIEGRNFNEETPSPQNKEMMISRRCAERLRILLAWDEVVGKQLYLTEHNGPYTIVGVYEDYLRGNNTELDERPSVQFYRKAEIPEWDVIISLHLIKLNEVNQKNIKEIENVYHELFPERTITVASYADEYRATYEDDRNMRDMVMIAGLVVLITTLVGLIGYCQDEMNRRRSELAVRKINGASLGELLQLFIVNVLKMAVAAIIAGCLVAYFVATKFMELFAERIALSWWIFVCGALMTLVVVVAVVLATTYKSANANPAEVLRK